MEFLYWMWTLIFLCIVGAIYNYIQLKREEREDEEDYRERQEARKLRYEKR